MTHEGISAERIDFLRRKMKEKTDWRDEELDSLSPKLWIQIDRQLLLRHYKIIAEVVQINGHCELRPKIGDRYVFANGSILIPEESTFPGICLWALAGIFPVGFMVNDRILSGLDPNEIIRDHAGCMDLGLASGGLGQVVFRVYCEKV
jgi:uncharacterized repeat protein (TIGR04076 family)